MFASDNAAPAHPAVLTALAEANDGLAPSYGADSLTARAAHVVAESLERVCKVYFVVTGGAANGVSFGAFVRPWESIVVSPHAHVLLFEGTRPEHFTHGARMISAGGAHRLSADAVRDAIASFSGSFGKGARPGLVSITNATECGDVYASHEVEAIASAAHSMDASLHVDGARFANAVASLGVAPSSLLTGVDVLSFGLTKGGAMSAEAVVVLSEERQRVDPEIVRARSGHLLSKHRYIAAQFCALLHAGLWLELARHANDAATELARILQRSGSMVLAPVLTNHVIATLHPELAKAFQKHGIESYRWPICGPDANRFVTSWATSEDDLRFVARIAGAGG